MAQNSRRDPQLRERSDKADRIFDRELAKRQVSKLIGAVGALIKLSLARRSSRKKPRRRKNTTIDSQDTSS